MRPRVILHNTVSLDGSVIGFEVDLGLHYRIAGSYQAEAHLVGSGTATAGIEMFLGDVPAETEAERVRPKALADDRRPVWVIPDTRGTLDGRLHVLRQSDLAQDPVILLSETTPSTYRDYLRQRDYRHHVVGKVRADLSQALELLASQYGVTRLLVDAGPTLAAVLLDRGLVDEISLIVAPVLVGDGSLRLFDSLTGRIGLALDRQERVAPEVLWVRYQVEGGEPDSSVGSRRRSQSRC